MCVHRIKQIMSRLECCHLSDPKKVHLNPDGMTHYHITLCHPLLGLIYKSLEQACRGPNFSLIFKGLQDVIKRRSGAVPEFL